jgi:hypothetical protein
VGAREGVAPAPPPRAPQHHPRGERGRVLRGGGGTAARGAVVARRRALDRAPRSPRSRARASAAERSRGSRCTNSRSFGCRVPVALRPTARTRSTPGSRRHSRSTPCPTMPVAPNRITFIAAASHHGGGARATGTHGCGASAHRR